MCLEHVPVCSKYYHTFNSEANETLHDNFTKFNSASMLKTFLCQNLILSCLRTFVFVKAYSVLWLNFDEIGRVLYDSSDLYTLRPLKHCL